MFKIKEVKDYVSFDTETTGLDTAKDLIVEYGLVRVRDDKIVDSLRILVKQNVVIPEEASRIHGITTEKMMAEGIEPALACQQARKFMGNEMVNGLNNIPYDFPIFENECKRHFVQKPTIEKWVDTGLLHKGIHMGNLWNQEELFYKYALRMRDIRMRGAKYNLDLLVKTYEVENLRTKGLHGAIEDATMVPFIFTKFKQLYYL
jgi:DNA polymerase III epsilon subunit-like protein